MLKRILYGTGVMGALAGAYLVGGAVLGTANAQTPTPQPTTQEQNQSRSDDGNPSYTSSIQVPNNQQNGSEADEARRLAQLAKITADEAKAAALAQFPGGTVQKVELENENGSLVYSVHLTDANGKAWDVKVDAGNGTVLHTEAEGAEGNEANEGPEGSEGPETADSARN